jgi:putative membrane protein
MKTSKGQRMHPLAALLTALRAMKDLIVPLLIFIVTRGFNQSGNDTELYWRFGPGVLIIVGSIIYGVFYWLRYSYDIEDGQFKIERGVFVQKKQFIPLERIQSIDLTEGVLHRMFGLARVQIQTAGGKKPEAILTAVTRLEANRLQALLRVPVIVKEQQPYITEELVVQADKKKEHSRTYRLSTGKLILAGMTTGSLGVALTLMFAVMSQLDEIIPNVYGKIWDSMNLAVVPFLIAVIIMIAWVLAVAASILKFANFSLTRTGEELYIERGLLERRKVTLQIKRIQAIRIVEEIWWQPFRLAAVHVESVGYGNQKGESTLLMPLLNKQDIEAFLQEIAPRFTQSLDNGIVPLTSKAKWGYVMPAPLFIAGLSAGLGSYWAWGWLGLLLSGAACLMGLWRFNDGGWRVRDDMLLLRYRLISRTTVLVQRGRVQSCDIFDNPWQRRKGLSTFRVAVASGKLGSWFSLKGLLIEDSYSLLEWFQQRGKRL